MIGGRVPEHEARRTSEQTLERMMLMTLHAPLLQSIYSSARAQD